MPASFRFKITVYPCKITPMGYEWEPFSRERASEVFEGTLQQAIERRDAMGKEHATSTDTLAFIAMADRREGTGHRPPTRPHRSLTP